LLVVVEELVEQMMADQMVQMRQVTLIQLTQEIFVVIYMIPGLGVRVMEEMRELVMMVPAVLDLIQTD
jgi:hypothetical protein